jgi:hypothetical protein
MSYDMLYRHKKLTSIEPSQTKPTLATAKQHINTFLLDGLRVQFKMYSRLCPWLLTWLDYEDDYEEDNGAYDDAGVN